MDFGFDVISAEEYERQRALYGPLTRCAAQAHRRGHPHRGRRGHRPRGQAGDRGGRPRCSSASSAPSTSTLRHAGTGRPLAWANPAVGTAQCDRAADGHPPRGRRAVLERVHPRRAPTRGRRAGCTAASARWCSTTSSARRPARADPAEVHRHHHAALPARHAAGAAARGGVHRADRGRQDLRAGLPAATPTASTVEAEGVFIRPAWARDAG